MDIIKLINELCKIKIEIIKNEKIYSNDIELYNTISLLEAYDNEIIEFNKKEYDDLYIEALVLSNKQNKFDFVSSILLKYLKSNNSNNILTNNKIIEIYNFMFTFNKNLYDICKKIPIEVLYHYSIYNLYFFNCILHNNYYLPQNNYLDLLADLNYLLQELVYMDENYLSLLFYYIY